MSRVVTLATASILLDEGSARPGAMVERGLAAVEEAARLKADLMVLPEEIDYVGLSYEDMAKAGESVPDGPIQARFAELARNHGINLIVGLREREGDRLFNVGVVIDRRVQLNHQRAA